MFIDTPPAIVYEIPEANVCVDAVIVEKVEREPICVMAFGVADPNFGVYQDNTKVHFFDHFDETKNARIACKKYVGMQYSSMILNSIGRSEVDVEFELQPEDMHEDLGLYLTHLSSFIRNGSYDSAVTIAINGKILEGRYVPHNHNWIHDDPFDLSAFVKDGTLQPGYNRLTISLHNDARSNYWIHAIKIK